MKNINFISGAALDFLLTKMYRDEFEVIDGLSQHPEGWNYPFWLYTNDLIEESEYNRLQAEIDSEDFEEDEVFPDHEQPFTYYK